MTQSRTNCSLPFTQIIINVSTSVMEKIQGITPFGPYMTLGITQPHPNLSLSVTQKIKPSTGPITII